MRCPKCKKEVPDGTEICPHCDHILDASFLGEDFESEDSDTGETDIGGQPVGSAGDDKLPPQDEVDREMEELRKRRSVDSKAKPPPTGPEESESVKEESSKIFKDMEGSLKKIWGTYKDLEKPDKLAVGGSAGLILFVFFPWVSVLGTSTISMIGLECGGWFSLLLGAAIISLVYLRSQEHWRDKEKYVIYTQVGLSGLAVLFILIQMGRLGSMTGVAPDVGLQISLGARVQIGLILSLVSAVVVAVGAFLLLKERVLPKKGD